MQIVGSKDFLGKSLITLLLLATFQQLLIAQELPARSQLLNGLRIAILPKQGDQDVLVKLRIHSGAAFDLAGKAGTAGLLGDTLFPDPTTREYFTEEMQGKLLVATDYDAITITMQGRAREFERIVEILRTALVTNQLTPENVIKARDGRIKVIRDTSISPAMVADRAIAARLFGDFPYGRPSMGTVESLERVERADLLLARERFLNPNNATLVVIGGVQPNRAMRVLRQLLGVWRKSESVNTATFRQPPAPDPRILVINAANDQSVEVRMAVRGLARKDPDATSAALLASIMRQRWMKQLPELARSPVFVRHQSYFLPGMFVMGTTIDPLLAGKALTSAQEVIKSISATPVPPAELEQAKNELILAMNTGKTQHDGVADPLLDEDTYGLAQGADLVAALNSITPADLQRTATRLFRESSIASVVVGNTELVKPQIERYGKVEMMGAIEPVSESKPDPGKSQTKTPAKP